MLKLTAVSAFCLVDMGMAVYNKHQYWDTNTTGYTAHIAGAMAGLVVGFFALENRWQDGTSAPPALGRRVQRWEVKLKLASCLLTAGLIGAAVLWNVFGDAWYGRIHPGRAYFLDPAGPTARCKEHFLR
jgi:hypothetical protein